MPQYEHDIFISYSHLDNKPLIEGQKGWISNFHYSLGVRLGNLLGREPKIWRDAKTRGNDIFDEAMMEIIRKTKIFLAILSPRYIESEWCRKELLGFQEAAKDSGGIQIDKKSRIIKVIKTKIDLEEHPAEIRGLLGYEFFRTDENDRYYEFKSEIGSQYFNKYLDKLEDVAYDACQTIKLIDRKDKSDYSQIIVPPEKSIYLAETTSDLDEDRDKIKRNLQQQGYVILPDRQLPLKIRDGNFEDIVSHYLNQCRLSIIFIGNKYGLIPEGAEKSIIELQNDLAAQQQQNDSLFHRLIWIPPNLSPEKRQQDFIAEIKKNKPIEKRTEIIENELEDFKTRIQETLQKINEPPPKKPEKPAGPSWIYLICDQSDYESIKPIEDCLFNEGFEVKLPCFAGDETKRRELHQEHLCICDAVMIYYNCANELWLEYKLMDLRKAPGFGRTKPFSARTVFVTGQMTTPKKRFRTHEAEVIQHFEPFSRDVLLPFISKIQSGNGGSQ